MMYVFQRLHGKWRGITNYARSIGTVWSWRIRWVWLCTFLSHQISPPFCSCILKPHLHSRNTLNKTSFFHNIKLRTCSTLFDKPVFCASCFKSFASGFWLMAKYVFIVLSWWCLKDVRIRFVLCVWWPVLEAGDVTEESYDRDSIDEDKSPCCSISKTNKWLLASYYCAFHPTFTAAIEAIYRGKINNGLLKSILHTCQNLFYLLITKKNGAQCRLLFVTLYCLLLFKSCFRGITSSGFITKYLLMYKTFPKSTNTFFFWKEVISSLWFLITAISQLPSRGNYNLTFLGCN